MSHTHMSMGSMGSLPALTDFPGFYYAVVGSAIGVAVLVNIYNWILYRQRLAAARAGSQSPAKPKSSFARYNATLFAITREAFNFSLRMPLKGRILRLPTFGRSTLILSNLVVLIVLCLYGFDLNDQFTREDIGFRCGVVTIAQLPLIFLLSGKNNIVGFLTGISYERLNWIHRWCARCMLLTATLHMGYFFSVWAPYDYIGYQLKNNKIVWKGLAAWCTLVWIVFSSMTPIRGWCYELFVLQHLISFALLLAFVYIHTPVEMNIYVWIPVGLFFFDRIFRFLRVLYANISVFHPTSQKIGRIENFFACKAEFTPLAHNTTRIVIQNPPISWKPGQHVFLSCHSIVPLQSHPFTIASIPEDGRMEFIVKAETGGTKRFFNHAEKSHKASEALSRLRTVAIEGPYGCLRPLRQFDSIVLLAGSTGATFTIPLLRDVLEGWKENASSDAAKRKESWLKAPIGAATRYVRFVWVVKSKGQLDWFSEQLTSVYSEYELLQQRLRNIKLELTIYITCEDSFTEEHRSLLSTRNALKTTPSLLNDFEHDITKYRSRRRSSCQEDRIVDEKEGIRGQTGADYQSLEFQQKVCEAGGKCCCRRTVDENAASDSRAAICCCTDSASPVPSTCPPTVKRTRSVHASIAVFSGRPQTREVIRRSLEQALGESAVVVCGPQGLVADVKQSVCSLSDERAVHKGTGAQGIYLHTESFGY